MSAYDDAVAYLDAEVHPRCDYDIYSDMSDIVDKMEAENAKLRGIVRDMRKAFFALDIDHCQACPRDTINGPCTKFLVWGSDECSFEKDMRELGIEV